MLYRAIGLMSGSSLDGLDIVFAEFTENGGHWAYQILNGECIPYAEEWLNKLKSATTLNAYDYQMLHAVYGHFLGELVNDFIERHGLHFKVGLIASHGHTTFHNPKNGFTSQLGDGSVIAAQTRLPVVSDLRAMDIALGGQGAPIVPIGEKFLFSSYPYFLNIGGIANVSVNQEKYIAFDVCPANRVLNMLSNKMGKEYDEDGAMAKQGNIIISLLNDLNALQYYYEKPPKSLANEFGTGVVFPMLKSTGFTINDLLRTYTEHIAVQIKKSLSAFETPFQKKLFVTGGGAFNKFLVERITALLSEMNIDVVVADDILIKYKEALIMAFIGVLRLREQNNVLSSVTGAVRNSIGGALWLGNEE